MCRLSILAISTSFRRNETADKAMAIMTLIGLIDLPIIHYSVYWWQTLHQGSSFPLGKKPLIDHSMLLPLGFMFVGFFLFIFWFVLKTARAELLNREYNSNWVLQIIQES